MPVDLYIGFDAGFDFMTRRKVFPEIKQMKILVIGEIIMI